MLAIIPARGGSKGLPRKNLLPVGGIPLISRAVQCARAARAVSRVIVTTDSEEIADVARREGAEVPFLRPPHLSSDEARSIDVYLHACSQSIGQDDVHSLDFVVLLPTVPLRTSDDVDAAVRLFREKKADSVISVTDAPCPLSWYLSLSADRRIAPVNRGVDLQANRQEGATTVIPNGAIYVLRYRLLAETGSFYGPNTLGYAMPRERSIDIDDEFDYEFANYWAGRQTNR